MSIDTYRSGMPPNFDHQTINNGRGLMLLHDSRLVGCQLDVINDRMFEEDLSDEEKQKLLKDLKDISTTSPYHWVDYFIGEWYDAGFGGEEKKKQAVVWYLKAINGGNAHAMYRLAVAYEKGNLGLTQTDTKANELYALAAEKGHAVARFNLGYNYKYGIGVEIDLNRCVELWEQSAKQGDVNAQFALSNIYRI